MDNTVNCMDRQTHLRCVSIHLLLLSADTSVDAPIAGARKAGAPSPSDFDNVVADLTSKKLSVGKLINRIQEEEKRKRQLVNEAEATASGSPLGQQQLEEEYARAQKARVVGIITQRIKSAKQKIATGGLENPVYWAEVGDASLELYYQNAPNTAYLNQALKTYNKVESLSTEYLNGHPSFYLKRAAIHQIMEDFESAIADLKSFASKKPITMPPTAIVAASVPVPASYEPIAAPRIQLLTSYVSTVSKLVDSTFHKKESEIRQLLREMPNPSREQLKREMVILSLLNAGPNDGRGLVARILGKVDQTSLYALQKNLNPDGTPLPLISVHESLESEFRTPKSYVIMDSDGRCSLMSIYNVLGGKNATPYKPNDIIIILDPFVKEVAIEEGGKAGKFRSVQIHNPLSLLLLSTAKDGQRTLASYAEQDIVPVE